MILFLNTDEKVVGHASNDAPRALPYKEDLLKEDLDTGAQTFEFKVPANHPQANRLDEKGFIVTQGFNNELLQFEVSTVTETHDSDGLQKLVYCEFAWNELNGHIVRPYDLPGTDARTALTYALSGTRWQVGTVDFAGVADLNSDSYDTALKMTQDVKEAFGGEIRYYVTMKNNRITGRFVDLVERVGENRGKVISFEKNLVSARRIYDKTNVATALIGLGRGDTAGNRLTFTTTTWTKGVNGAPADKPAGQDWIGDPEALDLWGVDGTHITRVFEYDTTSPIVLLQKTWQELQRRKNAVLQYEAEAAHLEPLGWDWEKTSIGDDVMIQDHKFDPPLMLKARVVQMERSKTDPTANKAAFGDYLPLMSNAQNLTDISSTLMKNYEKWGSGGMSIIRSATAPEQTINVLWVQPATSDRPFDAIYIYNDENGEWVETTAFSAEDLDAEAGIYKQAVAPAHKSGRLWLDTSTTPNVLKRSDGSQWIKATPTTAGEVGAEPLIYKQGTAPAHLNGRFWLNTSVTPNVLWRSNGSTWVKVTPTLAAEVQADAAGAAAAAQTAAENVARAEAALAQTNAQTYADGAVDAEEAARIAQAESNLQAARDDATAKANAAQAAAIDAAAIDAAQKASDAQAAAENVARAEAAAAQTAAEAYADGQVSAEEQARINQAAANLQAAKDDAAAKAAAAESAAKTYAELEADTAETNAKNASEPTVLKQSSAPAHLNGRLWLDTSVTPNVLKRSTGSAWVKATPTLASEVGAEGIVYKQATAPAHLNGRLWLDTSITPNILKVSNGSVWTNASPTNASQVGAETPTAAQNKAKIAEYLAYRAAVVDQGNTLNQQSLPIVNAPSSQYTATVKNAVTSSRNAMLYTSRPQLLGAIDVAVSDGVITAADENEISLKKAAYETDYSNLSQAITKATQDASGLTVGSINITDVARIGNDIYLGEQGGYSYKNIYFNSRNRIYSDGFDTHIYSEGDVTIQAYNAGISIDGGSMYFEGGFLSIEQANVNISGNVSHTGGVSMYGITNFYSQSGTNRTYFDGVEFRTNTPETGFCGVGGYNSTAQSGALAGVGVNFRVRKTYTPSSISIAGTGSNIANSSQVQCIDISQHGFWLYINAGTSAIQYRYWRGTYTA